MTDTDALCVLVAEDDLRIRTVLERFLQTAGYQVTACLNGREALAAFDASPEFDLLLTDINMPEMGGEELLRAIKQRSPQLPVIVLTARSDPDIITECFKHDAFRYLVKPFTRDDLLQVVKAALNEASRRSPGESGRVRVQAPADEKEPGWVELTAPNRQEYLDRFQDFCDRLIDSRLDDRAKHELKIAVQELGQNAIEWGNKLDEERTIRLSYKLEADRIKIRIADEGHGFNPNHVPDPTVDPIKMIENREADGKRPGGFGIHLARKVMDIVNYNERGNIVTMEKRFG